MVKIVIFIINRLTLSAIRLDFGQITKVISSDKLEKTIKSLFEVTLQAQIVFLQIYNRQRLIDYRDFKKDKPSDSSGTSINFIVSVNPLLD